MNITLFFAAILAGAVMIDYGVKHAKTALTTGGASSSTPAGTPGSSASATGSVSRSELQRIGAAHGWTGQQIDDWVSVIQAESGGDPNATNPSSKAFGIAQMLSQAGDLAANKAKYYVYGGSPTSVVGQLTAMANYIADTYGTPSAAWAHEQANRWY